jgi:hypothetical protein
MNVWKLIHPRSSLLNENVTPDFLPSRDELVDLARRIHGVAVDVLRRVSDYGMYERGLGRLDVESPSLSGRFLSHSGPLRVSLPRSPDHPGKR